MLAIQVECKQSGECVILDRKVGKDIYSDLSATRCVYCIVSLLQRKY